MLRTVHLRRNLPCAYIVVLRTTNGPELYWLQTKHNTEYGVQVQEMLLSVDWWSMNSMMQGRGGSLRVLFVRVFAGAVRDQLLGTYVQVPR
jgi:hypothetical protein